MLIIAFSFILKVTTHFSKELCLQEEKVKNTDTEYEKKLNLITEFHAVD